MGLRKVYLTRHSVERLLAVMNHFPDKDCFLVEIDSTSGIGTTINLSVDVVVNDLAGKFTVEIEGVENW